MFFILSPPDKKKSLLNVIFFNNDQLKDFPEPEDIESNRLNGRIVIVPTRSIEFISIDFVITNAGVSFE